MNMSSKVKGLAQLNTNKLMEMHVPFDRSGILRATRRINLVEKCLKRVFAPHTRGFWAHRAGQFSINFIDYYETHQKIH